MESGLLKSGCDISDSKMMNLAMAGYNTGTHVKAELLPSRNLAVFLSLFSSVPIEGLQWLQSNRLSLLSVPGKKCHIFEDLNDMINQQSQFRFTDSEIKMFRMLSERLKPLEGM